ncbi:hypothetical protein [Nocardioides sp. SYSU D00038]|uniref:hypothetical protein n=1 Tax=Nocardioides sp. SYSU D00038 TaxID=2812554 RepID=UPI001968A277|nr:hypothetical protein [Nocardioides sp. SYSU D00038]
MRRLLGPTATLLLVGPLVLLGGCGDEPTTEESPAPSASAAAEPRLVRLLHGSGVGGRTDPVAVALPDEQAVQQWASGLDDGFATELAEAARRARADLAPGRLLHGAVVHLGCEVPTGVTVTEEGDGLRVVADGVPKPTSECLVAVTTVALVDAPA